MGGEKPEHFTITLANTTSVNTPDKDSAAGCSSKGTYTITGTYVSKILCTAGSTSISYTNVNGDPATTNVSTGSEIFIKNDKNIVMTNSGSVYIGGPASRTFPWTSTLEIYF